MFQVDVNLYDGLEKIDLTDYIEHNEYTITSAPAQKFVKYYPCCIEPYPSLVFSVNLRRVSSYLNYWLLRPFMVLALLLPFVFCMSGSAKTGTGKSDIIL